MAYRINVFSYKEFGTTRNLLGHRKIFWDNKKQFQTTNIIFWNDEKYFLGQYIYFKTCKDYFLTTTKIFGTAKSISRQQEIF